MSSRADEIRAEIQELVERLEHETSPMKRLAIQRRIRELYLELEQLEVRKIFAGAELDLDEDPEELKDFANLLGKLNQAAADDNEFLRIIKDVMQKHGAGE